MSHALRHAAKAAFLIVFGLGSAALFAAPGDNVPMYGQPTATRNAKQKQQDEDYVKQASAAAGGDRKAAAKNALADAEKLIEDGNPDSAIAGFNKAWLLDPESYQAYWGFGRALLMRNNVDDSVQHFDKAVALINDPDMKPSLLTDAGIAYSLKASRLDAKAKSERAKLFAKANDAFKESTSIDDTFANAWLRWSQSLLREGNYADAWAKLKKAEENGGQIPKSYVKALSEKMPAPK